MSKRDWREIKEAAFGFAGLAVLVATFYLIAYPI